MASHPLRRSTSSPLATGIPRSANSLARDSITHFLRRLPDFLTQFTKKSVKTFILKPDTGCQGRGIALVQNEAGVYEALRNLPTEALVAQKYLSKVGDAKPRTNGRFLIKGLARSSLWHRNELWRRLCEKFNVRGFFQVEN